MIDIVEGVGVGSGKSFYVCTRLAEHIARGGTVVATDKFEIVWERVMGPLTEEETIHRKKHFGGYRFPVEGMKEYIEDEYGVTPEPDQFRVIASEHTETLHEHTPQGTSECPVLLILDEAQDKLNARDVMDGKSRDRKKAMFAWLCQSRHDDNDLIFITQNALNIDVQVRRLCTYISRVRNMTTFAIGGMKTPWWKKFCVNVNDQSGKNQLERKWINHDRRLFLSYTSKSQKGAHRRAGVISKKKLQRVQAKPISKKMKFLVTLLLIAVVALGYGTYHFATHNPFAQAAAKTTEGKQPEKREATSVVAMQPAVIPHAPPTTPAPAWVTITESFRGGDGRTFLHTDKGEYHFNTMCEHGLVQMIQGDSAKIITANGGILYLVTKYVKPAPSALVQTEAPMASAPTVTQTKAATTEADKQRDEAYSRLGGYPQTASTAAPSVPASIPPPIMGGRPQMRSGGRGITLREGMKL